MIDEALKVSVRDDDAHGVIAALARHGAEINATDERGMTALMYAAVLGNESAVSALIAKGARCKFSSGLLSLVMIPIAFSERLLVIAVNIKDENNLTAAMHAAYAGKSGVVEQLVRFFAKLPRTALN